MIEPHSQLEAPHKILLIEDDLNYAYLVELMLSDSQQLNCSIIHHKTLADGIGYLNQYGAREVAAVLLDLSLPDSEGFDTLGKLIQRFPNLNIIVLTGLDDKGLGVQAVRSGAQDFLVKGYFDDGQLAKALRYSIARNNILRRLEETQRIARIGHWECSPQDHYFTASEETYRIFGLSPQRPFSCEELMEPNCPFSILLQLQSEAQEKGKVQKDLWINQKDGERRYIAAVCTANRLSNGAFLFNGIIQDITERKQAEELKKARDLAQHTAKVREQFIAGISHEMRTPMNAILGLSNLLGQTHLDEEQTGYVQSIKQSSEVLLGIINDILQVATLQNNKIRIEKKEFQLSLLLNNLVGVMKHKALEKGLAFSTEIDPSIPDILKGDALRLNQVLYNLVGNALKFTDNGFVKIFIRLQEEKENRVRLRFDVKDSGIGIKENELKTIFEAFARVPQSGRLYEGTGLGLPIAKSLVEVQGGQIEVKSTPGKGSCFSFSLWLEKGTSAQIPKAHTPEDTPQLPANAVFRLLLVEDHKLNQAVARKTLEKKWKNIEVLVAENGEEAIHLLRQKPVDIILMDLQMPVRDGYSTTKYIRQQFQPPLSEVPILAMTAHAHISQDESFRKHGLDDFVLKPFEPEQLFQKIEYYLTHIA
ncbi:MAG: response regulator [Lewinellaceae bacterium]|nr:response regulator [Lewinellaceae bacterium]